MIRFLAIMVFVAGLIAAPLWAGDLGPKIPKATGAPHPEGNLYMRINHMRLLYHDRKQRVRLGDRRIKYSLRACVQCHAVKDKAGQSVSNKSDKYFCRVCHDYAAVKIDCFSCHNSKPVGAATATIKRDLPDRSEIAAYLKESGK